MFKFRAVFSPADLIIQKVTTYNDPTMAEKLQSLHDFLANIISLIALDDNSQKKFIEIEDSIKKVMDMEKKIAKILIDNGYEEIVKEEKYDTKKFNDLSSIVSAVSLPIILIFLFSRSNGLIT